MVDLIAAPEVPARDALTLPERSAFPALTLARINPAVLAELNLPLEVEGVAVMDAGPFGARAGLRKGDVVLTINGVALTHPDIAADLLSGKVRAIEMSVQRGAQRIQMRFRG